MEDTQKIYSGLYMIGNLETHEDIGGAFGDVFLPDYRHETWLFISEKFLHKKQYLDGKVLFKIDKAGLENMRRALDAMLHDMKQLERLSRRGLLKEDIYGSAAHNRENQDEV